MIYLTPFLSLVKASDVSGPITGAAAVALQRILASELLSKLIALRTAIYVGALGGSLTTFCACTECSPQHPQRGGSHQPNCGGRNAVQV